ncbi:MAG: DUF3857 domain-containing protein [Polyangia bacterium]
MWKAITADLHAEPRDAVAAWVAVLAGTRDEQLARLAIARLDALVAEGVDDRAQLHTLVAPPGARAQLALLRARVARLDNHVGAARAFGRDAGCELPWRAGASLGALSRLDLAKTVDETSFSVGAPGVTRQRECRVLVLTADGRPGAVPLGLEVTTSRATTMRLTVDTDQPYRVWLDGVSTPVPDEQAALVRRRVVRLSVPAGTHRVAVAVALPLGRLELGLELALGGASARAATGARTKGAGTLSFVAPRASGRDLLGSYLEAADALWMGDVVRARAAAERLVTHGAHSSAALALAADVAAKDPTVPSRIASDRARRLREQALVLDPMAARVRDALGQLALARERVKDALELALVPDHNARVAVLAAEALDARDRNQEARAFLDAARDQGECALAEVRLVDATSRHQPIDLRLSEHASRCEGSALYAAALRKTGYLDEAIRELRRVVATDPISESPRSALAEVLLETGRTSDAIVVLRDLVDTARRSSSFRLRLVDALLLARRNTEADDVLRAGLALAPESAELETAVRERAGDHGRPYALDRIDGRRAIREFEAAHVPYEGPAVFVLDRAVRRVFATGAARTITHNIVKVLTKEGIDRWGEWTLPDSAELLTLAAWKPDGSRLEPEQIAEKESISLPGLAVGDYVEVEYVVRSGPAAAFRGGFLGDRFYFASFDAPLDRSEYVVVTPHGQAVDVDARNAPPTVALEVRDEKDGKVDVRTFGGRRYAQRVAEPSSAPGPEYLPSVRVSSRVSATAWRDYLRDASWGTRRSDPALTTLAHKLVSGATTDRVRLERIDRWVRRNVKQGGGVEDPATAVLARREGNRATLVSALASAAGLSSRLVLARSQRAARVGIELEGYDQVLVEVAGVFDDPRTRHGRPGDLLPQLRGALALPLSGTGETLTLPSETTDARTMRVTMTLAKDGSGDVQVEEQLTGWPAVEWRDSLSVLASDRVRSQFEQHSLSAFFPGATLRDLSWEHADDDDVPFVVRYALHAPGLAHVEGDTLVLPVPFAGDLLRRYATGAPRQSPYLVEEVAHTTLELHVTPWAGAQVALSPSVTLDGKVGRFAQGSMFDRGTLVLHSRFDMPLQRLAADRADELLGWAVAVDRAEAAAAHLRVK